MQLAIDAPTLFVRYQMKRDATKCIRVVWCFFSYILRYLLAFLLPFGNCLELGVDVASFTVAPMVLLPFAVVDGSLDAGQRVGRTVVVGVGVERRVAPTWRRVGCRKAGGWLWMWWWSLLLELAASHRVCSGRRLRPPRAIVWVVGRRLKKVGSVGAGRIVIAIAVVIRGVWNVGDLVGLGGRSAPVVGWAFLRVRVMQRG